MADSNEDTGSPLKTTETDDENAFIDSELEELYLAGKAEAEEAEEESEEEVSEEQEAEEVAEEAESEEEESDEAEAEEDETPIDEEKFQKAFDKRMARELKKLNKQYEEKMSELDNKIKEAETPVDALGRAQTAMSAKDLDKLEEDAEKLIDFIDDNPDGVTINEGKDNEQFVDRSELLAKRKNARETLKAVTKRRKFIEEKQTNDNAVYEKIPSLKDKGSDEYQAVESVYGLLPDLRNHPKGTYLALCILEGDRHLTTPAKTPKKKTAPKRAPKLPDTNPTPKKAKSSASKGKVDLDQVFASGGDIESLEDALVQQLTS
jgi:hypothetical protein